MEAAERIRLAVAEVTVLVAGGDAIGTTISAGVAELQNGAIDSGERLLDRPTRPSTPRRPRAATGSASMPRASVGGRFVEEAPRSGPA